jgi:hypothetical protein
MRLANKIAIVVGAWTRARRRHGCGIPLFGSRESPKPKPCVKAKDARPAAVVECAPSGPGRNDRRQQPDHGDLASSSQSKHSEKEIAVPSVPNVGTMQLVRNET